MGKKSVKRKTRWRTLSITDSVDGNSPESAGNSTNTSNIGEAVSLNESFKNYSSNYSYLQRKSFDSSKSFGGDNRNSFSNTNSYYHNKYNNGTLSSASSKYGHRRRPLSYQNGSSRYYSSYWDPRAGNRNNRLSTFSDKENISKPRFNEDEYTRITTPRQDVIFKKGYLSQPKRYLSSTDTYTTSSAAASVISTEESISATSVPSLSPEQCSSHADSMDPEQAIMYSYFDQNGVLYVGPYMPNGFDQYSGQMFMLPYACPPYISPPDIISPSLSVDMDENLSTNTTDTNENEKNEKKEESIEETTDESKQLSENCDPKSDTSDITKHNCADEKDKNDDSKEEKKEEEKLENKKVNHEAFFNYGYQQYYPPMFVPYIYGPQFMPVFGADYETSNECFEEEDDELPKHKRKERDRVHSDQNSTSATTADYSEDDSGKEEISDPQESLLPETTCTESTQPGLVPNDETENKQIIFNANVEEFVPRTVKPRFNVHVKEFLPRRYKLKENTSTTSTEETSKREKSPENQKPSIDSQKSKETHSSSELSIDITANKPPSSANAVVVVQKKDLTIKKTLEKPSLKPRPTLADKIKKRLVSEPKQILFQQTNPPKSTFDQENKKKILKTNAYATAKNSPSYAQMLSKNDKQNAKTPATNATIAAPEPAKQQCIDEKDKLDESKIKSQSINNTASTVNNEWTTVKPRGKRAKHFREVPIEELIIDDKIVVEENEPPQETSEVNKNIIESPVETKEEKEEPEIVPGDEKVTEEESSPQAPPVKDIKKKTKKSKKTSKKQTSTTSHKKAKDVSFTEINIKTELKDLDNNDITLTSESAADLDQDDDIYAKDVALLSARNSSDENLSLNNIHSLDNKKFLFGKSFGCNPLNLNGFDYKLKGKQILKEEEEMVLSVIKSLSTNQSKQFENKTSEKSNCNSEEALKTKQNGINDTQPNNNTNSIITNGFSAEHETCTPNSEHTCDTNNIEVIEDTKEPPEEEDTIIDEDTIILYMNEEYVNNKSGSNEKLELSENDSVSDLSSDDSDQKLIEKNELNDNKTPETDCVNEINSQNDESEMEVVEICNGNATEERDEQVLEESIDENKSELNSFNSVNEQLPNLETILINNDTPYSEYIYKEKNLDDNHLVEFNHNGVNSVTTSTPETIDSPKVSTTLKDQLEEIENQLKKLGSITPRTLSIETLQESTQPVSISAKDESESFNCKNEVKISCNGTLTPTENCDQSISSISMQCENIKQTIEEDCHANIENFLQKPFNEFLSPNIKSDQEISSSVATAGDAKDNISIADVEVTKFNEIKHSTSTTEFSASEISTDQTSRSFSDTTLRSSDNNEEHIDYPLTTAVKQWLNEVTKENTPEPIFRIPSDPKLTSIIKSSIIQQKDFENIEADWTSDASDDDNLNENPKNLKSNPSHVSSVSRRSKRRLVFYHTDNDSDYNSDSQNKYDDNNTCERVALNASDITNSDFLDYWDDEFIRNPKKWLRVSRSTSIERESILSTTSSEMAPYDSVYGKSIDYNRLLANNYEFLSNNILSFNDKQNTNADIHETLINAKNDTLLTTNNNNFDNKHYDKENCLKPPEVCCILM